MTLDTGGFEALLRERLRDQQVDAAATAASLGQVRAARADGTADDEHDPEGSTLTADWSRITGLVAQSDARTTEILAALDRIADGTFGRCAACGGTIAPGRLDARPWAALCVGCASLRDLRR